MKNPCRHSLLTSFIWLLIIGCNPVNNSDKVYVVIEALDYQSPEVKIGTLQMFSFEDSTLAEAVLDSSGTGQIEFTLSEPTLAYLKLDDQNYQFYVAPGYDLKISVDHTDTNSILEFSGTGSRVNEYLLQLSALQEQFVDVKNRPIWQLDPPAFIKRLDSMRVAFDDFHLQFTDSVELPKALSESLRNKAKLKLINQKENYVLVQYSQDQEIIQKLKSEGANYDLYEVPFDTALLHDGLLNVDYALALKQYLILNVEYPLFNNKLQGDQALLNQLPILADQEIRMGNYPDAIQEFLLAHNINNFMGNLGITPAVDTIYANFKKRYKASEYIPAIEKQYNKWLAISAGSPAPDFIAETPDGDTLSLSDMKGKVVYVDVWATWCRPCIAEFPYSKKLQKEFEGNQQVAFLYVSVDQDEERWKKFLEDDKEFEGVHVIDQDDEVWNSYLLNGIPRYMLIDQEGKIVDANAPRPSSGKVKDEIEDILDGKEII